MREGGLSVREKKEEHQGLGYSFAAWAERQLGIPEAEPTADHSFGFVLLCFFCFSVQAPKVWEKYLGFGSKRIQFSPG